MILNADNDPTLTILCGWYGYACENLIKHCLAVEPTPFLRKTILEFSHDWHLNYQRYRTYLESIPIVIAAIRATVSSFAGDRKSTALLTDI
jgi:hypothetical protein